jgi:uncharacterized protein
MFDPIESFSDWLVFTVLNLNKSATLATALNFFIYESIKIFLLLCVIVFIFSIIRTFLPRDKVRKMLSGKMTFSGNLLAAFIGIFTPFCSCSAVPLFIGLVESGVPLGTTFSYLIAAPLINEIAAVLLLSMFGWKIALIYIVSGFTIAVIAGFILGKMKLEHLVEDYVYEEQAKKKKSSSLTWNDRCRKARNETKNIIKRVYLFVLLGIAVGAFIHGYAPENLLVGIGTAWYAVPLAVLIGVPLYSNAAGVIPIVKSLIEKGLPVGTSLSFMMATTALSIPEAIILRKVLKPKLLALYFGIVTIGIILTGYLFNFVLK